MPVGLSLSHASELAVAEHEEVDVHRDLLLGHAHSMRAEGRNSYLKILLRQT